MNRTARSYPSQTGPFGKIVKTLTTKEDVTFSRNTQWIKHKMFAYCSPKGKLVVKLPRERVEELVKAGAGEPFASGKDKYAPEWLIVGPDRKENWLPIANGALKFVSSKV